MSGLFQGLEIGKRALLTHQLTLQTIGHNIANVNTPGYTRQRVTISPSRPEVLPVGSVGSGVQADQITHIRDLFLGEQYREAQQSFGQWSFKSKSLTQIEAYFNEPQDNALGDLLNNFWDSWSALSTNADSASLRADVLSEANKLINSFHEMASKLNSLRQSLDSDITSFTSEINRLTSEIARLNQQIASSELGGTPANDLRDKRDVLTDDLASLVDVRTVDKANGSNIVYMGSMVLVDGADQLPIAVHEKVSGGTRIHEIVWKGSTLQLTNLNGQLYGLMESRDKVIPDYLDQLDTLAKSIVETVNQVHRTGYTQNGETGLDFFEPEFTTAATIRLSDQVVDDVSRVVASLTTDSDNMVALNLSELRDSKVLVDGTMTMNDYYNSLVGKLGIESKEADSFTQNFELLVQQVDNQRQSVQGVSLDEEMTNLVKFQHAYDAAARVITTMDQALDTLINGMGVVGR